MSSSVSHSKVSNLNTSKSIRKGVSSVNNKKNFRASELSASSKRKTPGQSNQHTQLKIIVDNVDCTPKSLLGIEPKKESQATLNKAVNRSTTSKENNSASDNTSANQSASQAGDPFISAWSQSEIETKTEKKNQFDATTSSNDNESDIDDLLPSEDYMVNSDVLNQTEDIIINEENPEDVLEINISETDTTILYYYNGICISTEDTYANSITAINSQYSKLKEEKAISDIFTSHSSQTSGFPSKSVKVGVSPATYKEIGIEVTNFDIFDSYYNEENIKDDEQIIIPTNNKFSTPLQKEVENNILEILASDGCMIDVTSKKWISRNRKYKRNKAKRRTDIRWKGSKTNSYEKVLRNRQRDEILKSNTLQKYFYLMESLLLQSSLLDKQLLYRDSKQYNYKYSTSSNTTPSITKLWDFNLPELSGYVVVDMKWNPLFPDILVAGYGQIEFTVKKNGFVLFWSLKNPNYPIKRYNLPMGVSSLDFSSLHPYLLAVGTYTGSIFIYDIRLDSNTAVLTNTDLLSKHSEAIWKLKWVYIDVEKGDNLVSISSDSKVKEWSTKRGLLSRDLMTLKRIINPNGCSWKPKESSGESLLSRISGGSSFDFNTEDASMYIVGTENGTIHKCSCSYNEQYIQTYVGHSSPIYELQFNKYDPNIFISCSSDNTIKIWDLKTTTPLLNIQSQDSSDSINHVCWSPFSSTVFSCVSKDGKVEIWDISITSLNPIATEYSSYKEIMTEEPNDLVRYSLMKTIFNPSNPIIACGDDNGNVSIYKLNNIVSESTHTKQLQKLHKATHPENSLL